MILQLPVSYESGSGFTIPGVSPGMSVPTPPVHQNLASDRSPKSSLRGGAYSYMTRPVSHFREETDDYVKAKVIGKE